MTAETRSADKAADVQAADVPVDAREQPKPCSCCGQNPREPYAMRCWHCLYR